MSRSPFDIDRAKLLIDEISGHLAALPAEGTKYAQLRAEVDALKAMLERPGFWQAVERSTAWMGQPEQPYVVTVTLPDTPKASLPSAPRWNVRTHRL